MPKTLTKVKREIIVLNNVTHKEEIINQWWVTKFLQLDDTPNSFSWQAWKVVVVKDTEDWLEFSSASNVKELWDLEDVDLTWIQDKFILKYDASSWTWKVSEDKSDKYYEQEFTDATSVDVPHNLWKYPCVIIMDTTWMALQWDIQYVDLNNVKIYFNEATSGKVVCN